MLKLSVRTAVLSAVASALLGCAQAELASINRRCDFSTDPRFVSLRGKVPLVSTTASEAPPTVRQLGDNSKPTPEQREALLALDDAKAPCRADKMRLAARYYPSDVVGLLQEVYLAYTNQTKLLV